MPNAVNNLYEFGSYRLEVRERLLLRSGRPVRLRGKVFETLCVLVANHGHLLEKEELMKAIWPDSIVEENNLDHNISVLRRALEESPGEKYIETVPRKGYRFVAAVRTPGLEATQTATVADMVEDRASSQAESRADWEHRLNDARCHWAQESVLKGPSVPTNPDTGHNVGRQKELAALWKTFEAVGDGAGALVCVGGEPGIGKTTLVEQFLQKLDQHKSNCTVVQGRCSERLAGSEAYLPIFEALENLRQASRGEALDRLLKLVAPTWYVQVAPLWTMADSSWTEVVKDAKTASRERMKRELNAFFQELSRPRPVVLFLDDLHWADASTIDMLAYAARDLPAMPLMVIVTYRPTEMWLTHHPFVGVRQELQKEGICRELTLEMLTRGDVERYLSLEFPDHQFPTEFSASIFEKTDGSPLFMVDLVRHLREHRTLTDAEGHWKLARPLEMIKGELPESVRSMIQTRIDQMTSEDRDLLAVASIQGQEFDSAVLVDVLDKDPVAVEQRLQTLDRGHSFIRLLQERELPDSTLSLRYRFVHVLYQNAIYGSLTPAQKTAAGKKVALALEGHFPENRPAVAHELALLWELGRDFARAADCFLEAAEHAAALFANEEALALIQRAMKCALKLPAECRQPRILAAANRSGQLNLTLSRMEAAITDFESVERIASELGDVEAEVNAICAAALAQFNLKRMEETLRQAKRAREIARAAHSPVAEASADLVLGLERLCFGSTAEAEASFGRSVPILRQQGAPLHALEAIGFAGLLHAWQLDYEEADQAVDWTLHRARSLGLPYHIVMNLFVRGMAMFNRGRLSDGLSDLQEGLRLAELNNEKYWLSRFPNTLGWAFEELQEVETAIQLNREGAKVARENRYGKPEANSHLNLAHLYLNVGESENAFRHLLAAQQIFEADVWFRWRYNIRHKAELARYWMSKGDTCKAAQMAAESLALAEPRKARKHMAWACKLLGDVASMEERFDDARQEYDKALGVLRHHRCPTIEWKIWLSAAWMASAYGDAGLAEHYRARCHHVVHSLADSITDGGLRQRYLRSEAIVLALC